MSLLTPKKSPVLEDSVFASRFGPSALLTGVLALDATPAVEPVDAATALPSGAPSVSQ